MRTKCTAHVAPELPRYPKPRPADEGSLHFIAVSSLLLLREEEVGPRSCGQGGRDHCSSEPAAGMPVLVQAAPRLNWWGF